MLPQQIPLLAHPPELLHCYQGQAEAQHAQQTNDAYREALSSLQSKSPSTVVVLQSHGGIHPSGLSFHVPEGQQYHMNYQDYGFPEENDLVVFDQSLAHHIQKSLHEYGRQSHVIQQPDLALPALLLADQWKHTQKALPRMLVIGVSLEGAQAHYEYGSLIARALKADKDPIAVVASGQLSHTLREDSAAGYVPIAEHYDAEVQRLLKKGDWQTLMHYDPFEIQEVGEDAYRPLMLALGMFHALEQEVKWKGTSYEAPQGIGYLCGSLQSS